MEAENINWEIIQTIIGVVVGIIAGVWAFFSWSNNNYNRKNNLLLESLNTMMKDMQAQYEENRLEDARQQETINQHTRMLTDHEKRLRELEHK